MRTWSTLIRPAATLKRADWPPQSAAVHGIAIEELRDAPVASKVVYRLLEHLGDRVPVSDASEFERVLRQCSCTNASLVLISRSCTGPLVRPRISGKSGEPDLK